MLKTSIKTLFYLISLFALNVAIASESQTKPQTEQPTKQLKMENTNQAYAQCIKSIMPTSTLSCTTPLKCAEQRIAIHFKNEAINLNCIKRHGGPVIVYSYGRLPLRDNHIAAEQLVNR